MSESLPLETPSMSRWQLLNFLTGAVVAGTAGGLVYPAAKFFVPPTEAGEDGSILAKDINGRYSIFI